VEKNLTAEGLASEVAALTVAKLAEANAKAAEVQAQLAASQAKVLDLEAEAAKRKSTIESAMAGKVVPKVAPVAVGAREQGAETGAGAAFTAFGVAMTVTASLIGSALTIWGALQARG
jgi:hypothetical protein